MFTWEVYRTFLLRVHDRAAHHGEGYPKADPSEAALRLCWDLENLASGLRKTVQEHNEET